VRRGIHSSHVTTPAPKGFKRRNAMSEPMPTCWITDTSCPECGKMQATNGSRSWCVKSGCPAEDIKMDKDWKAK
jgi:hypothetical protein